MRTIVADAVSELGIVEGRAASAAGTGLLVYSDDAMVEIAVEVMTSQARARGANGVLQVEVVNDEMGFPLARGRAVIVN